MYYCDYTEAFFIMNINKLFFKDYSKWIYLPFTIIMFEINSVNDLHLFRIFTLFQIANYYAGEFNFNLRFSFQFNFLFYYFIIRIDFLPFFNTWSE